MGASIGRDHLMDTAQVCSPWRRKVCFDKYHVVDASQGRKLVVGKEEEEDKVLAHSRQIPSWESF